MFLFCTIIFLTFFILSLFGKSIDLVLLSPKWILNLSKISKFCSYLIEESNCLIYFSKIKINYLEYITKQNIRNFNQQALSPNVFGLPQPNYHEIKNNYQQTKITPQFLEKGFQLCNSYTQ